MGGYQQYMSGQGGAQNYAQYMQGGAGGSSDYQQYMQTFGGSQNYSQYMTGQGGAQNYAQYMQGGASGSSDYQQYMQSSGGSQNYSQYYQQYMSGTVGGAGASVATLSTVHEATPAIHDAHKKDAQNLAAVPKASSTHFVAAFALVSLVAAAFVVRRRKTRRVDSETVKEVLL